MNDWLRRPTLEPVLDVETVVGPLLLPSADQMITQVLRDCGEWEPVETHYLQAVLRPGHTFVDVSAHVGYFSVLASRLVGPTGSVIAVEPEPRNLDLLHRNLARNGCTNARVIPCAAGSAPGRMALALDERNRGAHRLVALDDADAATVVCCVRLDDVLAEKVDVVKVDAQGYDHEVVAGLERTLAANRAAIVTVELSHFELDRRALDHGDVLTRYEELDFTLSHLLYGTLRRVSVAELLELLEQPATPSDFSLVLERPASAPFDARSRPARATGLEVTETATGLTVFDLARDRGHHFNATAALVFDLCSGERPIGSIVAAVQEACQLAEPPTAEVARCLDHLRREGVVV